MIVRIDVFQRDGLWIASIDGIRMSESVAADMGQAISQVKVLAMHWVAEQISLGGIGAPNSIYFHIQAAPEPVVCVDKVNIADLKIGS